ncbi:hypothetical protein [Litorihabitans aurantiacus]|uniref:DUF4190 domain-containing protein n=1 Tax=Litorihabitans aurantiacus TaxID=1930061 RepID=A0AA37UH69_9MICO|nr:hypothetical protein [Litorihabitans aurantiacus]GMA30354.1 hypothetical protein GCM10025875_03460 [Litorihabitans aurantiacus]
MTDPNQPQWQQPNQDQPQTPDVPPAPGQYGQHQPGGFDAPGAPGSYGAPSDAPSAPTYGAPSDGVPAAPPAPYAQAQQNPYGAPQGQPGPYAAAGGGPVPTSWRVWTAFPLAAIALLFLPPVFGGVAIVFSALALRRKEKLAQVALIVSIAATVVGLILGAIVNTAMMS